MENNVVTLRDKEIKFEIINTNGDVDVFTDSLTVAEVFGKQHKNFISKIEKDEAFDNFLKENKIKKSKYTDKSGKKNKMYLLDKDAFAYFVMGFTGKKASQWKLEYINAFNKMEKEIRAKQTNKLPTKPMEVLELIFEVQKTQEKKLNSVEKKVKVLEETKRLEGWQEKKLIDVKNKKVYELAKDNNELAKKLHRKVWSMFKKRFHLPRYNELPSVKFEEGLAYINSLKIEDMM